MTSSINDLRDQLKAPINQDSDDWYRVDKDSARVLIKRTILTRRITFANGAGERFSIIVSSGRIFEDVALVPRAFLSEFRDFLENAADLRVRSDRLARDDSLTGAGVSIEALIAPSPENVFAFAQFMDSVTPLCKAGLSTTADNHFEEFGEETQLPFLRTLAQDELGSPEGPITQTQFLMMQQDGDVANSLALITAGDLHTFLVVPTNQALKVAQIWQACLGSGPTPI